MNWTLKRSTRRLLMLLCFLPSAVLVMGYFYMLGMTHLEGTPRTYLESLQWATETLTTTGYGGDSHWSHPVMAVYVIFGQILGQFMVFLVFPVFFLPFFEERFEVRLPQLLPPMEGRVLVYRYGITVGPLIEELGRAGVPVVVLEEDPAVARTLHDRGRTVVLGRAVDEPAIVARVAQARAVVANGGDHANASFTMMVRELGYTGPLYALAADPLYRAPMLRIGATEVLTPAHVLGAALASRASTRIRPPAEGLHLLGSALGIGEFRVHSDSPLAGRPLGELRLREEIGVSVIGQWFEGEFTTTKGPATVVTAGAILVVVGLHTNLERIERLAMPLRRGGPIVVAGLGAVGQKVVELLLDADEQCMVVDQRPGPGVDVVGNVLDTATLDRARVRDAGAVILALSDDGESVFATAAVREYAPGVPLIVRVLRAANTGRLYRSGADFAISVGQVAAQVLAYQLLDQQTIGVENHIRLARVRPGRLVGARPWHHEALEATGAKIVGIERGDRVWVEFDAEFRVQPGDVLILCGSNASLLRCARELQTENVPQHG
jgi:Trk K+ transport system NAD-binding subunit